MKTFICVLLCLAALTGCAAPSTAGGMDIYTFSIGKADCSLLSFDGVNVLIDAGESDDGQDILRDLEKLGVKELDLVILTHFDKDHIGGFPAIARALPIGGVILPDYVRESERYEAMMAAIEEKAIPVRRLSADTGLTLKNAAFTFYPSTQPYDPEKGNDNELSLVTAVTYGQIKLLFMADAEDKWLNDLCYKGYDLSCDLMKFPYHGKWQKDLPALLALSLPSYVIITDSGKNPAAMKTLNALKTMDIPALRTADGNVHLFTDGKKLTVR